MRCDAYCMAAAAEKEGGWSQHQHGGCTAQPVVLAVVVVVGRSLHGTCATAQYRQNDRASFVCLVKNRMHGDCCLLSLPACLPACPPAQVDTEKLCGRRILAWVLRRVRVPRPADTD